MTQTYSAVLRDGRIEWIGEPPSVPDGVAVRIDVQLIPTPLAAEDDERARRLAVLERLVALGTAEKFGDPIEWQKEQRRERPLPGREP